MNNFYGNEFIQIMKANFPQMKIAAGGRELLTRCPYCGDSSNSRHAHLYIKVPSDSTELSVFNCVKCNAKGILTDEVLRKLGSDNSQLLISISKYNQEIMKLPKYKTLKSIDIYPLKNQYIRKNEQNANKLKYINDRIGSKFTFSDILKLKIVLNLYDLINSNSLQITRDKRITDSLDMYFLGFISYDNAFLNMRKVYDIELYKTLNKRYINYQLINKLNNNKNHYVVPTQLNVLDPTPVKIHIAEGPFDILSIYYNLNNCNDYQNVYVTACGKGYINTVNFILCELGIINYELHFYPDMDVSDQQFSYVVNKCRYLGAKIYVHRNTYPNEKDFGVPINRIRDYVKEIMPYDV